MSNHQLTSWVCVIHGTRFETRRPRAAAVLDAGVWGTAPGAVSREYPRPAADECPDGRVTFDRRRG